MKGDQIERRRRLQRIEECLLRGMRSLDALAVRFGVDRELIRKDIKFILSTWARTGPNSIEQKRELRVRQLENVMSVSAEAFQRSREDTNDATTTQKELPCQECEGSGIKRGDWCPKCEGTGVQATDITVRTKKSGPGDAAFLNIMVACVKEINYLEGNHAPKQVSKVVEGKVLHGHVHRIEEAPGQQQPTAENPYLNVPTDVLMDARAALARLKDSLRHQPTTTMKQGLVEFDKKNEREGD